MLLLWAEQGFCGSRTLCHLCTLSHNPTPAIAPLSLQRAADMMPRHSAFPHVGPFSPLLNRTIQPADAPLGVLPLLRPSLPPSSGHFGGTGLSQVCHVLTMPRWELQTHSGAGGQKSPFSLCNCLPGDSRRPGHCLLLGRCPLTSLGPRAA